MPAERSGSRTPPSATASSPCRPYTVKQIVRPLQAAAPARRAAGRHPPVRVLPLHEEGPARRSSKCQELGYHFPEVTGWIRATRKDFQLAKDMGLKETGILTSALRLPHLPEAQEERAREAHGRLPGGREAWRWSEGITPRCHFEDITRADFYGFVVPFAHELMKLAEESKRADQDPRLRHAGLRRALPRRRPAAQRAGHDLRPAHYAGVPERVAGVARAQRLPPGARPTPSPPGSTAAAPPTARCSASASAPGNPPLEGLVIEYLQPARDTTTASTPTVITEIADYFAKELGMHDPSQPAVRGRATSTSPAPASTPTGCSRTRRSTTSSTPPSS